MHEASFEKMRAVRNTYVTSAMARPVRVLDIGSGSGEGSLTYRDLFPEPDFTYAGLDIVQGPNVDIVPADTFAWTELASESFDLVISGQTFEHNPYFWITAAEIARVLTPGGLAVIIAPSSGKVHRHPYDCWRFYPDSGAAICAYVGLDLAESLIEHPSRQRPIGGDRQWHDALIVAHKPTFPAAVERESFYARIDAIVATRTSSPPTAEPEAGPAASAYLAAFTLDRPASTRARRFFVRHAPPWMGRLRNQVRGGIRSETHARGAAAFPWPPEGVLAQSPEVSV